METIATNDLRNQLGRRIDEVHYRGEPLVIEKNGVPMAVMVSFEWFQRHRDACESESGES